MRIKIIKTKKVKPLLYFRRGARKMKTDIQLSPSPAVSPTLAHTYTHPVNSFIRLMEMCHTCSQPPLGRFSSPTFKAGSVSSFCLQSPQHNEAGPLGTIVTINNHNSGVGCFQIPDSHSSELPSTHKRPPTPFSLCECDLCSSLELKPSVPAGSNSEGDSPESPVGQVGWDGH